MEKFGLEEIKQHIDMIINNDIIYKKVIKNYSILHFDEKTLNEKYGNIYMVKIDPTNSNSYPTIVIPGYSNKSFMSMLEIIIKNYESFKNICLLVVCWGNTVKQLSENISKDCKSKEEQYQVNEEFRIEMAKVLDKILRSNPLNFLNNIGFALMGKSAGGGIAIYITEMNENVNSLYLCCPATINGCKPLVNKKIPIYLSWNQDDKIIDISESFKFMNDMNKQHNIYKFYSYQSGGHELNPNFIADLSYNLYFI